MSTTEPSGSASNGMAKHFKISHSDINTKTSQSVLFTTEIISRRTSNLERYIEEGILIEEAVIENKDHLNSKGEWGRMSTKRLTVQNTTEQ